MGRYQRRLKQTFASLCRITASPFGWILTIITRRLWIDWRVWSRRYPTTCAATAAASWRLCWSLKRLAEAFLGLRSSCICPDTTTTASSIPPFTSCLPPASAYRKRLGTAVADAAAGRVRPEEIAAFIGQPGLTLAQADAWLAEKLAENSGGLAAQLRTLSLPALFDDLLSGGPVAARLDQPEDNAAVWERLASGTGLPTLWRELTLPPGSTRPEDMAFVACGWALAVEYVHDPKRRPVSALLLPAVDLPTPVVDACRNLAAHLRRGQTRFYQRTADEIEPLIDDEVKAAKAQDLGKIDTFRFEEAKVLSAALEALQAGTWEAADKWATLRLDGKREAESFWLQEEPARQAAWQLVQAAANLGQAVAAAGEHLKAHDLPEAVEQYVKRGAAADTAHRHLEQRRVALLYPQLPEFERLRACLDLLRQRWRNWADVWAHEFNALCRESGFLPPAALQQRTLFDQVVRPLAQGPGPAAYFVVDALRYEMADEAVPATARHPSQQRPDQHPLGGTANCDSSWHECTSARTQQRAPDTSFY